MRYRTMDCNYIKEKEAATAAKTLSRATASYYINYTVKSPVLYASVFRPDTI